MATVLPFFPVSTSAFVLFGALLVLVGSTQDALRKALGLDLAESGLLASTVIAGLGVGVLVAGPLVDRLPHRPLFVLAAGTVGLALCSVGPGATFAELSVLLLLAGVGAGFYETILNSAAIERYEERSVRTLSLMHSGATLGAVVTPFAVTWLVAGDGWAWTFRGVGAAHLLLALLALGVPVGTPRSAADREAGAEGRVLTAPLVWLLVAAFAYIGVESSITAFAVPYASEALGLGADRGRSAISVFWLGLLAGRLVFAMRAGLDDARPAALAGGLAAVAISLGVALSWDQIEILLGLVGFALGGVFPLLVALAGRRTAATGTGVAVVAGLGSAAGSSRRGRRAGSEMSRGSASPWAPWRSGAACWQRVPCFPDASDADRASDPRSESVLDPDQEDDPPLR